MQHKYLKDTVANIIFSDESCRDYLVSIVSKALNLDKKLVNSNLRLISPRVNSNVNLKYNYVDNIFENNFSIINLEVNYQKTTATNMKNIGYVCHMILKQTKPGQKRNLKPIYQINLNNYDVLGKNEFIYQSYLMNNKYHKKRDDFIQITDINIDFLAKIDYNKLIKEEEDSLEKLLYIFVCDDKEKLDKLYSNDKMMENVRNTLTFITDEETGMLYYNHDEYEDAVKYELGEKAGKEKAKIEIVKSMLKENIPLKTIIKITNLTQEEIESLK